jgi:hypothetical protein
MQNNIIKQNKYMYTVFINTLISLYFLDFLKLKSFTCILPNVLEAHDNAPRILCNCRAEITGNQHLRVIMAGLIH